MPKSAGSMANFLQDSDLPSVPRIGEVVKYLDNRYYKITAVVYQPFERHDYNPKVLVTLEDKYFVTAAGAVNGKD